MKLIERSVVVALLLLLLGVRFAHCQVDLIQMQQGGTAIGTAVGAPKLNFANCSVAKSGQTWTITCAGTGSNATQIQSNNVKSGVPNCAGQFYVWKTANSDFELQCKPYIDVRDYGVVGDDSTDDTAALNAAFSALPNYGTLLFPPPPNCKLKITSTINVNTKIGIQVIVPQLADIGSGPCGLYYWFPSAGGTMLYINQVHGSEWHHLALWCSGAGTGYTSSVGCKTGILVDEPNPDTGFITTNTSFFQPTVANGVANPSFVGIDIGPNAPGNVEQNFIYNPEIACGGPATGNTDTGIRIGSAGTGSQPNNNKIIGGQVTSCGRGFWIRGNTNGTDIGNVMPAFNHDTLYVATGSPIYYHDVVDQVSANAIHATVSGVTLKVDGLNTSGITTSEITVDSPFGAYISLTNSRLSAPTTLIGHVFQWFDFGVSLGLDSNFCSTLQGQGTKIFSIACNLSPYLVSMTFSAMNSYTPNNGSHVYCSDCNSTCTAGGSTGRTCFRENGAWTH